MSSRHEDGGTLFCLAVWHIKQGGDVDSGQAFENELLNVEAAHLNAARNLRIQWSFLLRQATEHGQQVRAQFLLNTNQIGVGMNLFPCFAAIVILAPCHFGLILQVRCNFWMLSRARWQDAKRSEERRVGKECKVR